MTPPTPTAIAIQPSFAGVAQVQPPQPFRKGLRLALVLDPLRLGLMFTTITAVSQVHQFVPVLARIRPTLLGLSFAIAYAIVYPRALATKGFTKRWSVRVILGLAVLACLSVPFGINMGAAGSYIVTVYWKTVFFTMLIALAIRRSTDLFHFVWAYVAATVLLALLMVFYLDTMVAQGIARVAGLHAKDANDSALVLVLGIPLALLAFQTSKTPGKVIALFTVCAAGAAIARSGSRGGMLGLAGVVLAQLLLSRGIPAVRRLAVMAVCVAGVMFSAPKGYWQRMMAMQDISTDYNWNEQTGRRHVAKRGLTYIMAYPFFGLGISNFSRAECSGLSTRVQDQEASLRGIACLPPHNSYVEAGAEAGIPGLILFSMLLFGGIYRMARISRRLPYAWRRGTQEERFLFFAPQALAASMFGFAICCTFLSFAWMETAYFIGALMAGLETSLIDKRRRDATSAAMAPA